MSILIKYYGKIKRFSREVGSLIMYLVLRPIARLAYYGKKVYLISERGQDARDNGYYLFRYMRQQHPELECYYVIDSSSPDCKRIVELGNKVEYRSLKHYLLFAAASYCISTHIMGYAPERDFFTIVNRSLRKTNKQIFLQHGITKDDIAGLYSENARADLFICGAKPEYDFVSANFHYTHGEVKYTGFARYDGLQQFETKRQILLMPTWRQYLSDQTNEEFSRSEYYKHWSALLNNADLQAVLEQTDVQLVFYPHFEVQKHIKCFTTNCDRITIADFAHYDVQTLLKESMVLVTDYSSVYFDFAYMKKPCIYYQFDETEFFAKHYHKGYFDYRKMGFGPVCTDKKTCVDAIIQQLKQNCVSSKEYAERMENFFPLHDDKNCERIFKEMEALH